MHRHLLFVILFLVLPLAGVWAEPLSHEMACEQFLRQNSLGLQTHKQTFRRIQNEDWNTAGIFRIQEQLEKQFNIQTQIASSISERFPDFMMDLVEVERGDRFLEVLETEQTALGRWSKRLRKLSNSKLLISSEAEKHYGTFYHNLSAAALTLKGLNSGTGHGFLRHELRHLLGSQYPNPTPGRLQYRPLTLTFFSYNKMPLLHPAYQNHFSADEVWAHGIQIDEESDRRELGLKPDRLEHHPSSYAHRNLGFLRMMTALTIEISKNAEFFGEMTFRKHKTQDDEEHFYFKFADRDVLGVILAPWLPGKVQIVFPGPYGPTLRAIMRVDDPGNIFADRIRQLQPGDSDSQTLQQVRHLTGQIFYDFVQVIQGTTPYLGEFSELTKKIEKSKLTSEENTRYRLLTKALERHFHEAMGVRQFDLN